MPTTCTSSNCCPMLIGMRGWLAVAGGFLVHLSLGTVYTIGNMVPYIVSYIRAYSHPDTLNYAQATWISALALMGQGGAMFLGGLINTKLGPRWTTLLGGLIMSTGVLLSALSIKVSYYLTVATYGLVFGIGVGIAYAPPLACAMKWFPNHKGLVNGIVVAGFGGGAFIFNQVQTAFINPHNLAPDEKGESDEKYFSREHASGVLNRVPHCFLLMGACYVVMQFVGAMLLQDPPTNRIPNIETAVLIPSTDEEESDTDVDLFRPRSPSLQSTNEHVIDVHPLRILRTRAFYTLWFTFLFNGQSIVFISTLWKTYGQTFIEDDHFLALVGAFASVCNCFGRIVWGRLADRFSFKLAMIILCGGMVVWLGTLKASEYGGKPMFFIWICLIFFTFSGNFALFPTAVAKAFGQRYVAINYGLLFTSQVVTSPIAAILTTSLSKTIGWTGMFGLITVFSLIGWILTFTFNKKNNGKDI